MIIYVRLRSLNKWDIFLCRNNYQLKNKRSSLNPVHFGPEFFLMQTLPDFKSKIVLRLPANKQRDGPTLFPLLEQCFQEVGLTEWKNIIFARCPDEYTKMFENLIECQQDRTSVTS